MKLEKTGTGVLNTECEQGEKHMYDFSWVQETHRDAVTFATKDKWCFSIVEQDEIFQFDLVEEKDFMRVEHMDRNGHVRYSARGIPEAFIRLAHEMFQRPIGSSRELLAEAVSPPGMKVFAERHSGHAEKVWKRLVTRGEAYRNDSAERFFFPKKMGTAAADGADGDGRGDCGCGAATGERLAP
jgi:hypothetical protein